MCENNELQNYRNPIRAPYNPFDAILEPLPIPNKRDPFVAKENGKGLKDFPGKIQVANSLGVSQRQKTKKKVVPKWLGWVEAGVPSSKKQLSAAKHPLRKDAATQENVLMPCTKREDCQM